MKNNQNPLQNPKWLNLTGILKNDTKPMQAENDLKPKGQNPTAHAGHTIAYI